MEEARQRNRNHDKSQSHVTHEFGHFLCSNPLLFYSIFIWVESQSVFDALLVSPMNELQKRLMNDSRLQGKRKKINSIYLNSINSICFMIINIAKDSYVSSHKNSHHNNENFGSGVIFSVGVTRKTMKTMHAAQLSSFHTYDSIQMSKVDF